MGTPRKIVNLDTGDVFFTIASAARAYDISESSICNSLAKSQKSAGGYRWAYVNNEDFTPDQLAIIDLLVKLKGARRGMKG